MKNILQRLLTWSRLPFILAAIAIALVLPSLWTGWQQDDLVHRYFLLGKPDVSGSTTSPLDLFYFLDGDSARAHQLMDVGVVPWWTLKTVRLSFWRPLSSLTHWVDYLLWPDSSVLMHLQNLFWFGTVVLVAAFVYRRFLGLTWVAGLAALFFALDDTHGLPAGWIANRNALLSGLFGLLALLVHDRWRREGWHTGAILGPLFLLLGLFAGESALGTCAYLFAYALFMDQGTQRTRVVTVLPYAVMAVAWLLAYSWLGCGTSGSGFYADVQSEPFRFMEAVLKKAPILLADQWGLPPSSIVIFLNEGALSLLWIWSVGLLIVIGMLLVPLVKRDRVARFWALGMILSILPVCSTMPHSRLLFYAGIGGLGLLAQWIAGVIDRSSWVPPGHKWRMVAQGMFVFFIVVHIVVAALLLPFNATSAAFSQRYIQDPVSEVAAGPEIAKQDPVILRHPIVFYAHYFKTARILAGQPSPSRVRVLAPGTVPLAITRPDEFTLTVRPEGGYLLSPFDNIYRGSGNPLNRGDRVTLTHMTAEISDVTDDGRPAEVTFRFSVPLEDPLLRWLQWKDGRYVPFDLPGMGEKVTLPAAPLRF